MINQLSVPNAFVFTPSQFGDERGSFLEWFRSDVFEEVAGHALALEQANMSISAAGVLRGIHFADVPPGQAKYVTCPKGAILDVVVDVRVGSPTFGEWDSVLLDDIDRKCVYIGEGLGHAFLSLEDSSVAVYLCSSKYAPSHEHGIDPFDGEIGIDWPTTGRNGEELCYQLSAKDAGAPDLAGARKSNILPLFEDADSYVKSLQSWQE